MGSDKRARSSGSKSPNTPPKKKRKVAPSPTKSPHKKVAKDKSETFNFSLIERDDVHTGPLIVEFPQGPPPVHAHSNSGVKIRVKQRETEVEELQGQRQLVVETKKIRYSAQNYGEESIGSSGYFIGIYNKKTKNVQVVPVNHIYRTKQQVKGYNSRVDRQKFKDVEMRESRQMLIDKFASVRQRTSMARRNENRISDNHMVGMTDRVGNTLDDIHKEGQLNDAMNIRHDLPKYDLEATDASKIYDISSIIPARDLNILRDVATLASHIEDEDSFNSIPSTLPVTISTPLKELYHKMDLSDSARESALLRLEYLWHMIEFYKLSQSSRFLRAQGHSATSMPEDIWRSLLFAYTESKVVNGKTSYTRSTQLQTKLVRYICVLALAVSGDYTLTPTVLGKDLNLNRTHMTIHLQQIGCVIGAAAATSDQEEKATRRSVARLKAPLKFPLASKKRFKRAQ